MSSYTIRLNKHVFFRIIFNRSEFLFNLQPAYLTLAHLTATHRPCSAVGVLLVVMVTGSGVEIVCFGGGVITVMLATSWTALLHVYITKNR